MALLVLGFPSHLIPDSHITPHPSYTHHHTAELTSTQDPAAALALVSARPASSTSSVPISSTATATPPTDNKDEVAAEEEEGVDLKRARELVELHYAVREKCKTGELARGLAEARGDVERALGG